MFHERNLQQRTAYARDVRDKQQVSCSETMCPPHNWRGSGEDLKTWLKRGSCSLRKASKLHGVPKTTLYDHATYSRRRRTLQLGCKTDRLSKNKLWVLYSSTLIRKTSTKWLVATFSSKYHILCHSPWSELWPWTDLLWIATFPFWLSTSLIVMRPLAPKAVTEKGAKNPSCVTNSTKAQITILSCVNAAGGGDWSSTGKN